MKNAVNKITIQEYTEAIRKYYSDDELQKYQRLGQFFCNHFNIRMSEEDDCQIFYERDDAIVMKLISNYIALPK